MANNHRILASIQVIDNISPIEGADAIECGTVLGWNVILKKSDHYHVGQKVVFFEIDSFLPLDNRYEFLRKSSYRHSSIMGEGFRIRSMRLRGVLSQGLVLPIDFYSEYDFYSLPVGTDLTHILNVRVWEDEEVEDKVHNNIMKKSTFHPIIRKTDEIRAQSDMSYIQELTGKPYYITEKVDGMSITVVREDGHTRVYSRKQEIADTDDSFVWQTLRRIGVIGVFDSIHDNFFIQGELYGPGIQSNRLEVTEKDFLFFNMGDPKTGEYYSFEEWDTYLDKYDPQRIMRHVKILETGDSFHHTLETLQELSNGHYDGAGQREGIVIRPKRESFLPRGQRLSFKVINNNYLIKHGL